MSLQHTTGFRPVLFALLGNALVTVIKLIAAAISGSSSMMSEAVHSVADTSNQLLLLIGLRRSLKKADEDFEYGYGNERFFWALVSACGIFFVGAGVTGYHGLHSFFNPEHIEFSFIIIPVLVASFFIELYTLYVATRQLVSAYPNSTWQKRLEKADTSTLAVVLEDAVAVFGVAVAGVAIAASYVTGNPLWDAVGSLVISALLAGVAIVLIVKNHSYLMGQSMPEELRDGVIDLLNTEPSIEKVVDFKSSSIGLGVYRIKCEVEWNGAALVREMLSDTNIRDEFEAIQDDFEEFKKFYTDFADRIPRLMGKKIDTIETSIRTKYTGIRHIDIEIN